MLLLGVIQAQASGGAAAGSFDLLETQVLSSSAASVTFSGLSTYAADYQHLQIRMTVRSSSTGSLDFATVRFNSDETNSFARHQLWGNGSNVQSFALASTNYFALPDFSASTATANSFGGIVVDVLDFAETTKNTTVRAIGGVASTGNHIGLHSGAYFKTDAISTIAFFSGNGANFVTGCRFSLYGLRKAA